MASFISRFMGPEPPKKSVAIAKKTFEKAKRKRK